MRNPLGDFSKMLQIESGEKAKDMAERLGVSPIFLSNVCSGKKKCPDSWHDTIPEIYELDGEQTEKLHGRIIQSNMLRNQKDLSREDKEFIELLNFVITNIELVYETEKDKIREIFKRFL